MVYQLDKIVIAFLLIGCVSNTNKVTEEQSNDCNELADNIAYRFCGADGLFVSKSEALSSPECVRSFGKILEECYDSVD